MAFIRTLRRRAGRVAALLRVLPSLVEPGLPTVRAAGWALLALRRLRRDIAHDGLEVRVARSPPVSAGGIRGVEGALRLARATCLERSLVVQRWLLAQGRPHDLLVGVAGGTESMEAHAWLQSYDREEQGEGFRVLARVAPRL